MDTEIKLEAHDKITLLDIRGDVTVASGSVLQEAYEGACRGGAEGILLKFASDAYINSGGIALLIQLLAKTKKNNQLVSITGLSEHFKKIFNMVGITKFAKIYDTVDEALPSLRQP